MSYANKAVAGTQCDNRAATVLAADDNTSPVRAEFDRSGDLINQIESQVQALYDRLESVLGAGIPKGVSESEKEPTRCPLASALHGQNERHEIIIANLRDILERLEL